MGQEPFFNDYDALLFDNPHVIRSLFGLPIESSSLYPIFLVEEVQNARGHREIG
jgi:hypothetical protein